MQLKKVEYGKQALSMKRELGLLLFLSKHLEWEIAVFFTVHNTFAVGQQLTVFSQVMVSGYIFLQAWFPSCAL